MRSPFYRPVMPAGHPSSFVCARHSLALATRPRDELGEARSRASTSSWTRPWSGEALKDPQGWLFQSRRHRFPGSCPEPLAGPGAVAASASRRSFGSNGYAKVSCVEAKAQAGSIDLVMVAKASLRASERPFRVSGSGWMQFL